MKIWVVLVDRSMLGAFATEQGAVSFAEGPGADPEIALAGGFADPNGGFEIEADGTWHASLMDGSEVIITPTEVQP